MILLDKTQLVHTMNEAYRRTATMDYDYGVFMSGPSKTADIEQALVFGRMADPSSSPVKMKTYNPF